VMPQAPPESRFRGPYMLWSASLPISSGTASMKIKRWVKEAQFEGIASCFALSSLLSGGTSFQSVTIHRGAQREVPRQSKFHSPPWSIPRIAVRGSDQPEPMSGAGACRSWPSPHGHSQQRSYRAEEDYAI
jgi:hypothetical protein